MNSVVRLFWENEDRLARQASIYGLSSQDELVRQFPSLPLVQRDEVRPLLVERMRLLEDLRAERLAQFPNVVVLRLSKTP